MLPFRYYLSKANGDRGQPEILDTAKGKIVIECNFSKVDTFTTTIHHHQEPNGAAAGIDAEMNTSSEGQKAVNILIFKKRFPISRVHCI